MHPILFQVGSFVVGTYGVMIVAGMLTGLWLVSRLARRRGLDPEFFFDLTFMLLVSGLIGARLVYILTEWREFLRDPMAMILSRQGFVFLGGFGSALIAGIWFTRRRHMPLLETCDLVAPALALAHGFGRIGCFFAGCCYGKAIDPAHSTALDRALAVQFPFIPGQNGEMFNFAYESQLRGGLIEKGALAPLPVLPTELFEMAGNFAICLVLLWFLRRRRFSGQIFALYLMIYSVLRFSLEFIRGDSERGLFWGGAISTSQIICLFTMALAIALWVARHNRGIEPLPAAAVGVPPKPPAAGGGGTAAQGTVAKPRADSRRA